MASFKGIPYAAAPVDSLRWKSPVPHPGWGDSPFNASSFGPSCPNSHKLFGKVTEVQNEDCLFLNVWSVVEPDGVSLKKDLPVVVFLHGGGFMVGSGSHPKVSADPAAIVPHHEIVYVSLNYRLGVLGFMAHPGMEDTVGGAFGLQDQILALKWVQTNIAAFGGDPTKVTLQGGSAGAMSIHHLMVMPAAEGLFSAGIMQSPLAAHPYPRLPAARAQARRFSGLFDCARPDDAAAELACLANVDAHALVTKVPVRRGMMFYDGMLWFPVVNGEDIPDHPLLLVEQGKVANVRTVVGTMRDEMSLFLFLAYPLMFKLEWAEDVLLSTNPVSARTVVDAYRDARLPGESDFELGARALSDMWTCSNHRFAAALSKHVDVVHVYHFEHVPAFLEESWPLNQLGVFHGLEMQYTHASDTGSMKPEDLVAVNHVLSLWRSFVNGDDVADVWPIYDAESTSVLSFEGGDQVVKPGRDAAVCRLWESAFDDDGLIRDTAITTEPWQSWLVNIVLYKTLTQYVAPVVIPVLSMSVAKVLKYAVPGLLVLYLVTGLRVGLVSSSSNEKKQKKQAGVGNKSKKE